MRTVTRGWSRAITAVLALLIISGCIIEKPPPPDMEEEPPPDVREVPPYTDPVKVVGLFPRSGSNGVPRNTELWVEFDQYLNPDELGIVSTIQLQSGGVTAISRVQYQMVDKRVVASLRSPLLENFEYNMVINNSVVTSVSGAPMVSPAIGRFTTGTGFTDNVAVQPEPVWADIEPIINEGCGCHTLESYPDPWFDIPALTYDRMVLQPSIQRPDVSLVEPFEPWNSYLMHKALPDYPDRDGTAMPPLWADDTELAVEVSHRALSADELRLIEDWIQVGAPRD